ncbi:hypothetical protein Taro_053247 [Colocasia esculenta]|uniref:Uncharacterized protein n=1 Tax=Colocasia esculenta TaxID=4460 RepID=A0A843XM91_COLES|nr:hypothetical protein [Colocasia esculenta]
MFYFCLSPGHRATLCLDDRHVGGPPSVSQDVESVSVLCVLLVVVSSRSPWSPFSTARVRRRGKTGRGPDARESVCSVHTWLGLRDSVVTGLLLPVGVTFPYWVSFLETHSPPFQVDHRRLPFQASLATPVTMAPRRRPREGVAEQATLQEAGDGPPPQQTQPLPQDAHSGIVPPPPPPQEIQGLDLT